MRTHCPFRFTSTVRTGSRPPPFPPISTFIPASGLFPILVSHCSVVVRALGALLGPAPGVIVGARAVVAAPDELPERGIAGDAAAPAERFVVSQQIRGRNVQLSRLSKTL